MNGSKQKQSVASTKARKELVQMLGGKCVICKENDPDVLQLDHILDDGKDDLEKFKSNSYMYVYYINHPEEAREHLQVLCANHNWKKRYQKLITTCGEKPKSEAEEQSDRLRYFEWVGEGIDKMLQWRGDHTRLPPIRLTCGCEQHSWVVLARNHKFEGIIILHCLSCGNDIEIYVTKINSKKQLSKYELNGELKA